MSLELNFVGGNAVRNLMGPTIQNIIIYFKEGEPVIIPRGKTEKLSGLSTRAIVTYNDGTTKRFDVQTGYTFKQDVSATVTGESIYQRPRPF